MKTHLPRQNSQYLGTAVLPELLQHKNYASTIVKNFNSVVVEHHQKWDPLCSTEGVYDFRGADQVVDWANQQGLKVKAHTLMWHVTTPRWFETKESKNEMIEQVRRHIYTTVSHFRERVVSWDVVNESLAPSGILAENVFLKHIGEAYIEDSFKWAKLADPNCRLIYNDNKVEAAATAVVDSSSQGSNLIRDTYCSDFFCKSDAMYELVKRLVENKAPIDEVGLQGHFTASGVGLRRVPLPQMIVENVRRYKELGLSVNISEMDVRIQQLREMSSDAVSEQAQCDIYRDIVSQCFSEDNFSGLTCWGFTDKHTWIHDFYQGSQEDTPLLFDKDFQEKPACAAVVDGLKSVTSGRSTETMVETFDRWNQWFRPEPVLSDVEAVSATAKPDWELEAHG